MSHPTTRKSERSERPRTVVERAREDASGVAALLVLGLGFLALFGGFDLFFLVWIIGFVVVVPLVAMLFEDEREEEPFYEELYRGAERFVEFAERAGGESERGAADSEPVPRADALATLRDRYARGELTDEQFERKLDALLETDTPENAAAWRRESRDRNRERERESGR